jgi:hypothetical protein
MPPKVDKRLEGLKELASMIAEAYRRQITGKDGAVAVRNNPKVPESDANIEVFVQRNDLQCGGLYTETVKVENFLRNLRSRARKTKMVI